MFCQKHNIQITGCSRRSDLMEDCRECDPVTFSIGPVMEFETIPHWQEKLAISIGMSTQEVLEKFLVWQEDKKTCERCGGEEYFNYCPMRLVCEEAMTLLQREEAEENDSGRPEGEPTNKRGEPGKSLGGVEASFVSIP